jgi:hypothetical protein
MMNADSIIPSPWTIGHNSAHVNPLLTGNTASEDERGMKREGIVAFPIDNDDSREYHQHPEKLLKERVPSASR